jgi:acetoin utilization protein AcuB
MTRVADYMTPGPHTIGREQSVVAAKQMMQQIRVRHLPVLHGGKLVGVLSDRDLAAIETLPGSRQMTVEDAMVPEVYITSEDASLATVAGEMARQRVGSAVVVKDEHVVGVFTAVDALRALAETLTLQQQATPA